MKRFGFMLTHAMYLTTTASQGKTLRTAVKVDCARNEPQGNHGTDDDAWWLNLYAMFSRVTRMADMLLVRPPPRELLEWGPPASVRSALQRFERVEREAAAGAVLLAPVGTPGRVSCGAGGGESALRAREQARPWVWNFGIL